MSSSVEGNRRALVVAFLSAVSRIGRTGTVANLGLALAAANRRVLIVDLGTEGRSIASLLAPFAVTRLSMSDDDRRLLAKFLRASDGLAPGDFTQYQLSGSTGSVEVYPAQLPSRGDARDPQWGSGELSDLRSRLVDPRYDYVLIDAPTKPNQATLRVLGAIADVAAICFRPRQDAIDEAVDLAGRVLQSTPLRMDIVPVVTKVDDRVGEHRIDRSLAVIRREFNRLRGHSASGSAGDADQIIQMPYTPTDAFEHLLVVVAEDESDPFGVLAEYRRLVAAVTRGAVTTVPPISPLVRARYRRAYQLDPAGEPDTIVVAYAPVDRVWADWACALLAQANVRGVRLRLGEDEPADTGALELVLISSAGLAGVVPDTVLRHLVEPYVAQRENRTVLIATVDETGYELPGVQSVDLSGLAAEEAEARLLTRLGLFRPIGEEWDRPTRFPADDPSVSALPPQLPGFVGRDDDLESLRDQLLGGGAGRASVTITGGPGVGKTELAKEYAYRFKGDYDLVWWFAAHDLQSLLLGLHELADRMRDEEILDLPTGDQQTSSPLTQLATNNRIGRWLLVMDNVDDLRIVDSVLPVGGGGHVLITTMDRARPGVELANLPVDDGTTLLLQRMPDLPMDAARQVALAVEGLPLALQLAGSWLAEAVQARRAIGAGSADATDLAVHDFLAAIGDRSEPDPVVRVVRLVTRSLQADQRGRLAVLLAEFCSFLSTQGVGLPLVHSSEVLTRLVAAGGADAAALALDASEIDRVLWIGHRYDLFQVSWGSEHILRIHRVVRDIVREDMPVRRRDELRTAVLAALAAYAPTEVEEDSPSRALRFVELQKHVLPCGAIGSDDPQVRRWMVNQLRFLYTDAGFGAGHGSTEMAHKLLVQWTGRFGPADPLRARLATQLANIERSAGKPEAALQLDEDALLEQRRNLGRDHPQTLTTARGRAGDLRGMGRFSEAVVEDEAVWRNFARSVGPDHPQTRRTANNLATSLSLAGDADGALELEFDNFDRRLRLFGPQDPNTWQSLMRIGVYQRELGRYAESYESLQGCLRSLRKLKTTLPPTMVDAGVWHLSITERLMGDIRRAKDHSSQALRNLRETLGPRHPYTLACMLSTAMDYRAGHETGLATGAARTVKNGLRQHVQPDHPFFALAGLCLGLCLAADDHVYDGQTEVDAGLETLRAALGDVHPWALAARIAQARVEAATGNLTAATELVRTAHETGIRFLGTRHPITVVAAHNLATVSSDAVYDQGWRDIDVDIPQT